MFVLNHSFIVIFRFLDISIGYLYFIFQCFLPFIYVVFLSNVKTGVFWKNLSTNQVLKYKSIASSKGFILAYFRRI